MPRSLVLLALALAHLALLTSTPAAAKVSFDRFQSDLSAAELGADRDVAAPGDSVRLVFRHDLAPGWHTYWRNPGGPGMATRITWDAPEGVEISDILWPTPGRKPFPPYVNFGFSDEVLLTSVATVPEDWPAGEPIALSAHVEWLICSDQCIIEGASFSLSLPTGAAAEPDPEFVALAERAAARRPDEARVAGAHEGDAETYRVSFPRSAVGDAEIVDGFYYPETVDVISAAAPQAVSIVDDQVVVEMRRAQGALASPAPLTAEMWGVFAWTTPAGETAAIRLASFGDATDAAAAGAGGITDAGAGSGSGSGGLAAGPVSGGATTMSLALAAVLAFAGGLILNVMPCVFPVLALKAMSLVETASQARAERLMHVGAYAGGVVLSFLALAAVLIGFKSAGGDQLWGFHLQSPGVVGALALVMFVVGLNFSGVFEFSGRLAGVGSGLAARSGASGSFFTGVLAVVVASPCTAPFMITALGFALTQDAATGLVVFGALGLGFAAPLTLLGLSPRLARALPKPGPWMVRFRQLLAFPMYGAAAVLLWVLGGLAGREAVLAGMIVCVLVATGLWLLGSGAPASTSGRRWAHGGAATALAAAALAFSAWIGGATASAAPTGLQEKIAAARADGRTVFVNVTADWCISCKGNEWWVLASDQVGDAIDDSDALYLVADWTRRDPEITAFLDAFDHPGVPLYVVYRDGGAPEVLPQILTIDLVLAALGEED